MFLKGKERPSTRTELWNRTHVGSHGFVSEREKETGGKNVGGRGGDRQREGDMETLK